MARATKRAKRVRCEETIVEVDDAGNYENAKVVGTKHYTITREEAEAQWQAAGDWRARWQRKLDRAANHAAEILRPHLTPGGLPAEQSAEGERIWSRGGIDLGDGPKCYWWREPLPVEVQEAFTVLDMLRSFRRTIERDDVYALLMAFDLGMLTERMGQRPFGPLILSSKRNRRTLPKAREARQAKSKARQTWIKEAYSAALNDAGQNVKRARKLVVARYGDAFPDSQPISAEVVKKAMRKRRKPARK
jgi:hypothetical protein